LYRKVGHEHSPGGVEDEQDPRPLGETRPSAAPKAGRIATETIEDGLDPPER
jgi:hypothetical protein